MNLLFSRRVVGVLVLFGTALGSRCAHAATYTVSNLNSSGAGSLSQAMSDASATVADDTINFSVSGTITVPALLVPSASTAGKFTVSNTQSASVVLSGGGANRLFAIDPGGNLSLSRLTLSNGFSSVAGGAIYNYSNTTLSISGCTLSNNTTNGSGGAILSGGSLFIVNSTFSGNTASTSGGAIISYPEGSASISGSTFSNNSTTSTTGSGRGGAIDSGGPMSVSNSTFSGNSSPAGQGGAIFNGSAGKVLSISSSTLADNSASNGGGGVANVGTLNLKNSIVANNFDNVFNIPGTQAVFNDQGNNITGGSVFLLPLADNGGPTKTRLPDNGSPAIDAGAASESFDQRGVPRPQGSAADIGSVEVTGPLVVTSLADNTVADNVTTLREAITTFNATTTTSAKTITFAVSGTITLSSALPLINSALTSGALSINNTQSGGVTISGAGVYRVLNLNFNANVSLDRLMLTNGFTSSVGGAVLVGSGARLLATNCTFSSSTATDQGGAISVNSDGGLTLTNCTLSGNSTSGVGGAIYASGASLPLTISSCTISNNRGNGQGGSAIFRSSNSPFTLNNSIVAGNISIGSNISGPVSGNNNLSDAQITGSGNINSNAPLLGALGDNGGPTFTMLPQGGSPAIDAGSTNLPTDQRGFNRPSGTAPDIGAVEAGAGPAAMETVVTSLLDTINPSDGVTTLREAITAFNASSDTSEKTIVFAVSGTITLTSALPTLNSATTSGALSINNTQSSGVTISGANTYRIFTLATGANLSLSRLALSDGKTTQQAPSNGGGAILNSGGAVSISSCTLSNNTSTRDFGGAIFNDNGTLSIVNSTLSGNSTSFSSGGSGGAIMNIGTTVVSISSSTISNNSAVGSGGGIYNFGSTISLNNSIVAGNTAGSSPDIDGSGGVSGNNNISSSSINGSRNIVSNSPFLSVLSDNGGPTFTMLPLAGSPAINAGSANAGSAQESTDQRGIARPQGSARDIGAVEVVLPVPALSINSVSLVEGNSGTSNMVFTVSLSVPTSATVGVKYGVSSGTATAGTDFGAPFDSDGGSPSVLYIPGGATTGTIIVPIIGDTVIEPSETLTVALSTPTDATLGTPTVGTGTIQNDDTVPLLISEFRMSGPGTGTGNGASDEFIELANTTGADINLAGWMLSSSDGALLVTLGSDKSIKAGGHFLITNSNGYSLSSVAGGDVTYSGDIAPTATLSLKDANGNIIDFVGTFSVQPNNPTNQYAFVRRLESGFPVKTGTDTNDFNLVDTSATVSTSGATGVGPLTAPRLGAPGPQNTLSPIQRNDKIGFVPINAATVGTPAEGRYASKNSPLDSPNGRLTLRRTITNNSGQTVTKMRFRIVAATSGTSSASGVADLRALTSAGVTVGGTKIVNGITLDAPSTPTVAPSGFGNNPASSGNGGGLNSSWTVDLSNTSSLLLSDGSSAAGGIPAGKSINVEFLFAIVQNGSYRLVVDTELVP